MYRCSNHSLILWFLLSRGLVLMAYLLLQWTQMKGTSTKSIPFWTPDDGGRHLEYLVNWEGYSPKGTIVGCSWTHSGPIIVDRIPHQPSQSFSTKRKRPSPSSSTVVIRSCPWGWGWGWGYCHRVSRILSTRPLHSTRSFTVTRILSSNTCTSWSRTHYCLVF